jgi:mercuric ion transport protein
VTAREPAGDGATATAAGLAGLLASLGAIATWFCCLPIFAGAASALAGAASFAFGLRPWLLSLAGASLAFGFWRAYRPIPCAEGGACATPRGRRRARVVLWVAAVVLVLAATFPWWNAWLVYALL